MLPSGPADGVTACVSMLAEQLAVVPPFNPAQLHVHGPCPLTTLEVPALHRFVVGAVSNMPPFDEPQRPLTGGSENVAVTVQFAVIGFVV